MASIDPTNGERFERETTAALEELRHFLLSNASGKSLHTEEQSECAMQALNAKMATSFGISNNGSCIDISKEIESIERRAEAKGIELPVPEGLTGKEYLYFLVLATMEETFAQCDEDTTS